MAATTMILLLLYCCFCNVFFLPSSAASSDDFLQCLTRSIPAEQVYTQSSSAFMSVLTSSVQNPEFVTNATGLYLGGCSRLAATMRAYFPELGMTAADCHELTWLRAMAFISLGSADAAPEGMLRRTNNLGTYVKSKSDYVRRPMGAAAWDALFSRWLAGNGNGILILEPHGGVVGSVVPDFVTPYPHRAGVLYNIQYGVFWWGDADGAAARRWLEALYAAMEAAVSSNPREAFANYRDLDIGENVVGGDGVTTYESARAWGERYFMGNFRRLAAGEGEGAPGAYFRTEQSIPPLLLPY
uniref:Berberine/berberine-like domain-containing protein n=1 Tax=Oryza brachyantha TaxID=4533 RepID=J3N8I4_ORYBR